MSELSDAEVDAGLKLSLPSYDPRDWQPEISYDDLRAAYRAGVKDVVGAAESIPEAASDGISDAYLTGYNEARADFRRALRLSE